MACIPLFCVVAAALLLVVAAGYMNEGLKERVTFRITLVVAWSNRNVSTEFPLKPLLNQAPGIEGLSLPPY